MSLHGLMISPKPAATPSWLITFVDLVMVILSFFILLFSMSQPDPVRYTAMAQSYVEAFTSKADLDAAFVNSRSYVLEDAAYKGDLPYLEAALKATFARSANLEGVQFRSNERYLVVSLPRATTRDGVAVAGNLAPALFDLGGIFANIDNRLAVIGLAEATVEDWEKGLRSAGLIARALQKAGYNKPIDILARVSDPFVVGQDTIEIMIMAGDGQATVRP